MTDPLIVDLDDDVIDGLRAMAARNHRSLDEEVRTALARAVRDDPPADD